MKDSTLTKAIQLKQQRDRAYLLRNQAYNGGIYLKVTLNGTNVTKEVDCGPIKNHLEKHFLAEAHKLDEELQAL